MLKRSFCLFPIVLVLFLRPAFAQNPPTAQKIEATCMSMCHGGNLVAQQRLDRNGWTREVDKMIRWGAPVPPEEKDQWIGFLASRFNNSRPKPNSSKQLPDGKGADLARIACLGCHDDQLLRQPRFDRAAWERVVDRMIGLGVRVPSARKQELIEYLTAVLGK